MARHRATPKKPPREPQAYEGRFSRTPGDVETPGWVHLDGTAEGAEDGPCPWSPRVSALGGLQMPEKGDRCIVVISNDQRPWIVGWWPHALP